MDKKQIAYYYRQVKFIRPRYFFIASLVFLGLGVWGMRQNNLTMIELRQEVIQADKEGGDVESSLADLREYVYNHMNTDLSSGEFAINPPIQLKSRYERLLAEKKVEIDAHNRQVTAKAEQVCAEKYPGTGFNAPRVACVQEYVADNAKTVGDIPEDLYKFDFVSPKWTPDFAGINLALSVIAFALFIVWLIFSRWVRSLLD